jgi:acetyl-CoA carboxylase carboxyl transferase subunit alpha
LAKKHFSISSNRLPSSKTRSKSCATCRPSRRSIFLTEIDQLSKKSQQLTKDIYSDLTPWQITKIARHAERPYTLDYVNEIFTHFVELHGDRHFADDLSIVGGLARFNGTPAW